MKDYSFKIYIDEVMSSSPIIEMMILNQNLHNAFQKCFRKSKHHSILRLFVLYEI